MVLPRVFCHEKRQTHFGSSRLGVSGHRAACGVQVEIVTGDYAHSPAVPPFAVFFTGAACAHAFAATGPVRYVPEGTVVFYVRLVGVHGAGK